MSNKFRITFAWQLATLIPYMQIVSWTKAEIRDTIIFTLQSPKTTLSTHKTRRFCMTTTTPLSGFPISLKTTMEDWTNFGYHFSGELILLFSSVDLWIERECDFTFTLCMKCEMHEWHFTPFTVILSEKLVSFSVILREIAEITWIGCKWEFMT